MLGRDRHGRCFRQESLGVTTIEASGYRKSFRNCENVRKRLNTKRRRGDVKTKRVRPRLVN